MNMNKFLTNEAEIRSWLKKHNQNYIEGLVEIDREGLVTVKNDVYMDTIKLDSLRVKFKKVSGNFIIIPIQTVEEGGALQRGRLTSLEGCPFEVGGDFDCTANSLTSLVGGPQVVGRDYFCLDNLLTSLKGIAPKIDILNASNNLLTDLKYFPLNVGTAIFFGNRINDIDDLLNCKIKDSLMLSNNWELGEGEELIIEGKELPDYVRSKMEKRELGNKLNPLERFNETLKTAENFKI